MLTVTATYLLYKRQHKKRQEIRRRNSEDQKNQIRYLRELEISDWKIHFGDGPGYYLPADRPLRLLSLDGGGIRGYLSLLMLQHFMRRVAPGILPCQYFDLIGGTSTGGLIAIMLGRLRMPISECLNAYLSLAREVFDTSILEKLHNLIDGHKFRAEPLEDAIKRVVEERTGDAESVLFDESYDLCRTFVVAIPGLGVEAPVKHFRTYTNPGPNKQHFADTCEIWKAARATSAAPSFFPAIEVDGVCYADGGLGYNNPAPLVLEEAKSLWGPNLRIGCFLSLGTGKIPDELHQISHWEQLPRVLRILKDIALSCESAHHDLKNRHDITQYGYLRWNPILNKNIGMDQWEKMSSLEQIAQKHAMESREDLDTVIQTMNSLSHHH